MSAHLYRSVALAALALATSATDAARASETAWREVLRADAKTPSDEFPILHRCYREPTAPTCKLLRAIKQPDWSRPEDIIVVPHRGYWGFGDVADVPENSRAGFRGVSARDYIASEVDFMPTLDGLVMSHDYVLSRLTEVSPTDTRLMYEMKTASLTALKQRDRFGVIQASKLLSASETFLIFSESYWENRGEPPIIFVDVKQRPDKNADTYALNWVKTLSTILEATPYDQLYQLAIKTPYTPRYIINNLSEKARDRFLEVLWMPQVASNAYYQGGPSGMGGETIRSSADFVDIWQVGGAVLAFETNYKNPSDSRLQPFERDGIRYDNILDYIKQTVSLRGGVFAEEPVGERGVVNRMAEWKYKDASEDQRGDFVVEAVAPQWGNFIVITTDRPDVWQSVKHAFWPPAG